MDDARNSVMLSAMKLTSGLMEYMLKKGELKETEAIDYFIYMYDKNLMKCADKWGVDSSLVEPKTDTEIVNLAFEFAMSHVKGAIPHYRELRVTEIVDGFIDNFYKALWNLGQKYGRDYDSIKVTDNDIARIAIEVSTFDMGVSLDRQTLRDSNCFEHCMGAYEYATKEIRSAEEHRKNNMSSLSGRFH